MRFLHTRLSWAVETTPHPARDLVELARSTGPYTELIIVDEADRLETPSLEAYATTTTTPASA